MQPSLKNLGIKINYDTLDLGFTAEQEKLMAELYQAANQGNRRVMPRIKQAIARYPHIPQFKNFLYALHSTLGNKKEARQVMQTIRELHPEYVMGKITYAIDALDSGQLEEAAQVLDHFDLKKVAGQRKELHHTEVLKTWYVAARYHLERGDTEQADPYFSLMDDLDPDSAETQAISQLIVIKRMQRGLEQLKEDQKLERFVDSFPTYVVPQSKEPPTLPHPELESLYLYSEESMPEEVVQEILELPRESMRAGLRMILEDSYRRFNYFTRRYKKGWDPEELSFPLHALYFLREVGEPEDLDALLNLYRQGEEILEFWFGDFFSELNWYTIYELGQGQLDKLKAFVLEPNLHYQPRLVMSQTLAQLAVHQPARREEVLEWFRDVFQYHLDHPDDEKRIDTAFLGWSAAEVLNLRAKKLWPLIEQMYDKGFIPPHFMGDLSELGKNLEKPFDPHDIKPLPTDIFEHYQGSHLQRRAKPKPDPEFDALLKDPKNDKILSAFSRLLGTRRQEPWEEDPWEEEPEYGEPQKPAVSTKVGRNDPCPCGSGKKYKKCCGKR